VKRKPVREWKRRACMEMFQISMFNITAKATQTTAITFAIQKNIKKIN